MSRGLVIFFFQAEDGIRDYKVTGVQTCALPLYRSKAKHILETCRLLVERHGGKVPESREALEALPGVGRKTANVILNTPLRHPTIPGGKHIFRLPHRTRPPAGQDGRAGGSKP